MTSGVRVGKHRRRQACWVAGGGDVTLASLHDVPTVILASRARGALVIDFLHLKLAYIGDIQISVGTVEGEAPGVAQAQRPDLFSISDHPYEGVVHRDAVPGRGAARRTLKYKGQKSFHPRWRGLGEFDLDIDAQQFSQKRGRILRISTRIAASASIAGAYIQVAIRTER